MCVFLRAGDEELPKKSDLTQLEAGSLFAIVDITGES